MTPSLEVPAVEFRVLEAIPGYWPSGGFVNKSDFESRPKPVGNQWFYYRAYKGARYRIEIVKVRIVIAAK